MSDPTAFTALGLAELIRRRELGVREVVESHLARIHRLNPDLGAVVRCSESALTEAEQADRAVARGQATGRLHGVPFTVKDWIETEGLVCDGGYGARRDYRPGADATAVRRLRRAGAILLGKTRAGSDPELHPVARNPWDTARTAGSSSGGEAAIIAARGSPVGLGSDSGGSLRWPAHCCGVTALKPSAGLVPLTGHFPPIITLTDPRTVIGPVARSVMDLAALLEVIAGPDGADPSTVPVRIGDLGGPPLEHLRLAWFAEFQGAPVEDEVRRAVEDAVNVLRPRVKSVCEAVPPRIEEAMDITRAYWARPESTSLETWRPWGRSTLTADEVEASLFRWDRMRRAMLRFMHGVDVLVCPVAGEVAPARHEPRADDYRFTVPFSLTGNPVVVAPAGTGDSGLPIAVQVVAAPFRDHLALTVAAALEEGLAPFARPLDLDGMAL